MPKYKEFDVLNTTPREVVCIRSDNDVYGGGGDYMHRLTVGKTYFVECVCVFNCHTILHIRDFGAFNSVLFAELE